MRHYDPLCLSVCLSVCRLVRLLVGLSNLAFFCCFTLFKVILSHFKFCHLVLMTARDLEVLALFFFNGMKPYLMNFSNNLETDRNK